MEIEAEKPAFSIDLLLQKAGITDESTLKSYKLFLDKKRVNSNNVTSLTKEELTQWAKEFDELLQKKEGLRADYSKAIGVNFDLSRDTFDLGADAAAIAEAAQSYGKKGTLSLLQIIDNVYKQKPEWKCVFDTPENVAVDTNLQWVGRQKELKQLEEWALENISNHLLQTKTKQMYRCPLVHGGLGVGKSRLVVHSNRLIEHNLRRNNPIFQLPSDLTTAFNDAFGCVGHIFIDFSVIDKFTKDEEVKFEVSTSLGLRIASHFFFGVGLNHLLDVVEGVEQRKQFTFEKVCALISEKYAMPANKHVLLTIQLDEFSEIAKPVLNDIVSKLAEHAISRHDLHLCILPQLTGTDTDVGIKSISNSRLLPTPLLLEPLAIGEEIQLFESQLKGTKNNYLLEQPLFIQAVDSLGRVPRYIEFLLKRINDTEPSPDLSAFLRLVLNRVIGNIKAAYGTNRWEMFLGESSKGVRTMLLWALSARHVALRDKLNGITVEQARSTGILLLEEVKEHNGERYIINVPLILLRALNDTLRDISDDYLDPIRIFDDREFERVMTGLRIMRQNMLVGIGKSKATYRELYPYALGYDDDLDREVPLQRLSEILTEGSSATHAAMHKYPMTAVPVMNCPDKTVDISKGGFLIRNAPKASDNDAFIVHPPAHLEGIQFKSSDNITRGIPPDPSSQGVLVLGLEEGKTPKTIWAEYNKVTDADHEAFYSALNPQYKFNLFVISNKPLKNFDKIKQAVAEKNYSKGLPRGVSVICYENFQGYAASFAHRGLYIPLKRKGENSEQPKKKRKGNSKKKSKEKKIEVEEDNEQTNYNPKEEED